MATPNTKTTSANGNGNEMPPLAQKAREQLVAAVQRGQNLSLNATRGLVKAVSVLPVMDMPAIPGFPTLPSMEAATTYTFDVAEDLLSAQREFALQLADTLAATPAKTI